MIKIVCPKCGRVLGDTNKSVDCNINCKNCKKTVRIRIKVANSVDYLQ